MKVILTMTRKVYFKLYPVTQILRTTYENFKVTLLLSPNIRETHYENNALKHSSND